MLRLSSVLFGVFVFVIAISFSIVRQGKTPPYAIIINSNIRDYDQALYLVSDTGDSPHRFTAMLGSENTGFVESLHGQWLLINSNVSPNLFRVNVISGKTYKLSQDYPAFSWLQMSFDGQWVYLYRFRVPSAPSPSSIVRVSMNDGVQQMLAQGEQLSFKGLSPDETWLYYFDIHFMRLNLNTGIVQAVGDEESSDRAFVLGWSADHEWMYVNYNLSRLVVMRPDGSDQRQVSVADNAIVTSIFNSPHDNASYLFVRKNVLFDYFYQLSPDGGDVQLLAEDVGNFVGWTSDPNWVLFQETAVGGTGELYRLHLGTGERQTVSSNATPKMTLSPLGDMILLEFSSEIGWYRLFETLGDHWWDIPQEPDATFRAWSPDGEWLYFEKFSDDSSELFRVNTYSRERQTVHRPALHNNYVSIFQSWYALPNKTWNHWHMFSLAAVMMATGVICGYIRQRFRPLFFKRTTA